MFLYLKRFFKDAKRKRKKFPLNEARTWKFFLLSGRNWSHGTKTDSRCFPCFLSSRANMKFYWRHQTTSIKSMGQRKLTARTDPTTARHHPKSSGRLRSFHSSAITTQKTTREPRSISNWIKCSREVFTIIISTFHIRKLWKVLITSTCIKIRFKSFCTFEAS